jgi:hypothetical protein
MVKAYEFPARVTAEGDLDLPEQLRHILPVDAPVRVLILVEERDEPEEGSAWSRLAAEQLLARYADADDIYDRVP